MTATAERTRLELLQAKEAELAMEVNAARARIALYPDQLHEARSRAIYAKPNVRPGAVRSVIAEEAARLALEEKAEALKQLELLHEQEAAVWAKAGGLLGELATVWNSYVAQVEQSHQFARANGLESSDARAVIPGPSSFREFLELLLAAATDETVRSEPHTEQLVDSGIYGRRDENGGDIGGATYDTRIIGSRTLETRRRLDERDILFRAVPDLRSIVLALQFS